MKFLKSFSKPAAVVLLALSALYASHSGSCAANGNKYSAPEIFTDASKKFRTEYDIRVCNELPPMKYTCSQEVGERQLSRISIVAPGDKNWREDAWIFVKKKNGNHIWIDIGYNSDPKDDRSIRTYIIGLEKEVEPGDEVTAYHIQPCMSSWPNASVYCEQLPTSDDFWVHKFLNDYFENLGAKFNHSRVVGRDVVAIYGLTSPKTKNSSEQIKKDFERFNKNAVKVFKNTPLEPIIKEFQEKLARQGYFLELKYFENSRQ